VRGRAGVGWSAGKISQTPADAGGFKFCACEAGGTKSFNPRRTLMQTLLVSTACI